KHVGGADQKEAWQRGRINEGDNELRGERGRDTNRSEVVSSNNLGLGYPVLFGVRKSRRMPRGMAWVSALARAPMIVAHEYRAKRRPQTRREHGMRERRRGYRR